MGRTRRVVWFSFGIDLTRRGEEKCKKKNGEINGAGLAVCVLKLRRTDLSVGAGRGRVSILKLSCLKIKADPRVVATKMAE